MTSRRPKEEADRGRIKDKKPIQQETRYTEEKTSIDSFYANIYSHL